MYLYFKESVKSDLVRLLVSCILVSSCVVSQITSKLVFCLVTFPSLNVSLLLVAIAIVCSSYVTVLYSFLN